MRKFLFVIVILMFCTGHSSSSGEADIYRPKKNVVILRVTDSDGSVILQKEL